MALAPVVIGVDSSTQSAKAVAVDVETGRILGTGRAPHTVTTGEARESDPTRWGSAFDEAVAATGHAGTAEAVSVGGQQHGLVVLDAAGAPLRPALLWNDVRSAPQAEALTARLGARGWADRAGSLPTAAFTIAKWLWLRENEPAAASAAAAVRLPHDYLTGRLTGAGTTDRGDASGTGWWTPAGYDTGLLALAGLDPALLPEVVPSGTAAGTVRPGGVLREGALVAAGTGDNMAAALGLGLRPGVPVLSLGTSGTVFAVTRGRPADPTGTVAGFADAGRDWLPLACTLNCTLAVDRFAALLGLERDAVEAGGTAVVLPFLDGERTPNLPHASGLVHGLRHDTTAGQLLQSAYDGAVHTLLTALDDVLRHGGESAAPGTELLLIGGGARGAAWRRTVRRLSGRPVRLPRGGEFVALGAAAQAAGLLTGEPPYDVARRWGTADGPLLDPLPCDGATADRIAATLTRAAALQTRPAG